MIWLIHSPIFIIFHIYLLRNKEACFWFSTTVTVESVGLRNLNTFKIHRLFRPACVLVSSKRTSWAGIIATSRVRGWGFLVPALRACRHAMCNKQLSLFSRGGLKIWGSFLPLFTEMHHYQF